MAHRRLRRDLELKPVRLVVREAVRRVGEAVLAGAEASVAVAWEGRVAWADPLEALAGCEVRADPVVGPEAPVVHAR